jgi:conjugal transfer/entry exclusion protein
MVRRVTLILLAMAALTVSTSAQLVVIDPANLVQTVLIAQRAQQVYEQLQNEYVLIQRMAQRLGDLSAYRIPPIAITRHDSGRWEFGRPWIEGLNSGDARGTAYLATALPLQRPDVHLTQLDTEARRMFERRYATVEISDSVAMLGGHQVALLRGYHDTLQAAVENLQDDVLNGSNDFHQLTAVLDKVAAGELLARRQDMAANQLLSHAVEQLLARNKRERDTEAATINMQLTTWRDAPAANTAFALGAGDALRTWRQP